SSNLARGRREIQGRRAAINALLNGAIFPVTKEFAARLVDLQQFDVEHQRRVRRDNAAGAPGAIAELGRDHQRAFAADLHPGDALVPAFDDLLLTECEIEGLAAIERAVELGPLLAIVVEPAGVMDADLVAGRRGGAVAD